MNSQKFSYRIAGLSVEADIELPSAARRLQVSDELADVRIVAGLVPESLDRPRGQGAEWEYDGAAFLLRVPGVGRFLMVNGRDLRYDQDPAHTGGDLPLYLVGTCLAVLLGQRGLLVLHASAVTVGGRAMLFCGEAGAGKSTLAARLCQSGYDLLSDDLCSVARDEQHGVVIGADGRRVKLWQASIAHLALEPQRGPAVQVATEKYYMQATAEEPEARPPGAIYLLACAPDGTVPTLERLSPVAAMHALEAVLYRPVLVRALEMEAACFAACSALLRHAPVYRLSRPKEFCRMDEVVGLLEAQWQAEAPQHPLTQAQGAPHARTNTSPGTDPDSPK